ncbi:ABC transporter permease/substrate-binding protein [Erythrobacter sp.]|uniref:ABC transporter permease/substrate-binding protein n=1 Tax=Erythrobacter sp. TaxID=1042 RepID=UPI001B2CE8D5|nr:ABC transporter permease/substrate-binding protein [Erythrobacter sp.]MBO6527476.1 ABC transporter permease/substrate-binding protein [Erythrobacter sp.]MBO6530156.1 ABC transporter permease/substrate-binding protein [Erythrobacter sp.]
MNDIGIALLSLGDKLAAHVLLSASAIALGIAVALPLAIWASRSPAVARATLGFASLVQTIPALALLALFFPILLSLRAVFGEGLPTLGFLPSLLALSLYALLPILRNAVTAQANLDPGVIEAADGVGMSFWQRLRLVEAPLSAPYIMAGIRTAAVWTIGAATLSTTIGQPSLGDPIFAGLQTQNWVLVLAGCIASAGLALVADALLGMIEKGLATRRRLLAAGGLGAVVLGILAALTMQFGSSDDDRIVIGAKSFSEQYILARLIGQRLEAAGYSVDYRDGLGSAVAHRAVSTGAIDVLVDYTGTIWTNQMERRDNPDRDAMLAEIIEWETRTSGTHVLGRLGFENAYGLAMPRAKAEAGSFESIGDLAARAPRMIIGGDPEFFERPDWFGVRDTYGLRFAERRNFSPTFMYNALQSGEADVIGAYTSDGRIAADDLVFLDDPEGAFPNYDAIVLLSPETGAHERIVTALSPLVGAIDVEAMRAANLSVDREEDQLSFDEAARRLAQRVGL